MSLTQIKVGGFGGQGVILTGTILGKAGAIFDKKYAAMSRSYGPEARGGACSAQILVSDEPITYPYVIQPDYLVALSQEACERYAIDLAEGGAVLYEKELVNPSAAPKTARLLGIPCTRIAEELGSRVVLNMVMLGFFAQVCPAISADAIKEAIRITVPRKTIDVNILAFDHGYQFTNAQ
ncbi:MAG: pyruvate ferredoxin oxidoreductase [Candidatus Omnitrophota bacterium]|jgi:2-oxoglutarate ferredoxin oxidoreductase subunit gamma|nr:MAG: pyruvate ferredoxin oxidoreductase [Candidatus Omnitrophota bacterium]